MFPSRLTTVALYAVVVLDTVFVSLSIIYHYHVPAILGSLMLMASLGLVVWERD